jgi:hypothetical protein
LGEFWNRVSRNRHFLGRTPADSNAVARWLAGKQCDSVTIHDDDVIDDIDHRRGARRSRQSDRDGNRDLCRIMEINDQNWQTSRSIDSAPRALFDLATGKP